MNTATRYRDFAELVEDDIKAAIDRISEDRPQGCTRREAAAWLLDEKPGWYKQTPEGEYLLAVVNGRNPK
jgi:hypothetical protein